ncbi:MAG: response regulator [Candidatus Aminicenantes bacterium]|nr:response regulator [Candidatus Aminicenantes bacterium]
MNDRIIYIDDNIDDLDPLVQSLFDEGFSVKVINDSKKAQEYIKSRQYDIILLDLYMGERSVSGNQLFDEIREVDEKVPVVIISGNISTQTTNDCLKFINNEARAIFKRTEDNSKIVSKIKEIRDQLNIFPGGALEDWIQKTKQSDAVLMVTKEGRKFTAADILNEIRLRTPLGLQFERDLNKLTIDLITRGKEQL